MSRRRTTTSYAILGLLTVRDWSSYELAKQVRRSLNWFWPRAERKLYDEPKWLAEDGLATAQRERTGDRGRTVYRVTDDGRSALREWLGETSAPRTVEFEAMVKVFFADAGTREQLLATLQQVQDEAEDRLSAVADYATGELPFPRRSHLSALGLVYQYEQDEALRRWAGWAREQVGQWPGTDDPGSWDVRGVLDGLARSIRNREAVPSDRA